MVELERNVREFDESEGHDSSRIARRGRDEAPDEGRAAVGKSETHRWMRS